MTAPAAPAPAPPYRVGSALIVPNQALVPIRDAQERTIAFVCSLELAERLTALLNGPNEAGYVSAAKSLEERVARLEDIRVTTDLRGLPASRLVDLEAIEVNVMQVKPEAQR